MATAGGTMTLAFTRAALGRLAAPAQVYEDARRWTEAIGLVSDDAPDRLSAYADRVSIDPDFISSVGGQAGGLAAVRQQYTTDRHVLVGTTDEDRRLAQSLGWEYLPVTDAAESAGWTIAENGGGGQADNDE